MNWILRKSNKFDYHTNLKEVIKPIFNDIADLNWLVTDLEYCVWDGSQPPISMDDEYRILNAAEFKAVANTEMQIIWGIFLGVPQQIQIQVDLNNLPYAENTAIVWKNGNIQYPGAVVEIICFDSGYTIIKFMDEALSTKFKAYFEEAIELEKFKNKSAPYY
ncbi:hypothetical protein MTO98_03175 [Mucilaginibacter sp. SMC90]|uniref:hypothetical protein n=1 Tax=Mucilaginibacter sp. SMC90 TaxID=2929803 RepID=UPI001FB395EF|nr:hypothetical protein [Mucilaginibacter sp. SMC90]UOE50073.1 hypothetical protein MTO98_03175 [Mucilaginibacter sp. SMC90]